MLRSCPLYRGRNHSGAVADEELRGIVANQSSAGTGGDCRGIDQWQRPRLQSARIV